MHFLLQDEKALGILQESNEVLVTKSGNMMSFFFCRYDKLSSTKRKKVYNTDM